MAQEYDYPRDADGLWTKTGANLVVAYSETGIICLRSGAPLSYTCEKFLADAYRMFGDVLAPFERGEADPRRLSIVLKDTPAGLVPDNWLLRVAPAVQA